jgi:hypothetical protein
VPSEIRNENLTNENQELSFYDSLFSAVTRKLISFHGKVICNYIATSDVLIVRIVRFKIKSSNILVKLFIERILLVHIIY